MTMSRTSAGSELDRIKTIMDVTLGSGSIQELCKRLVHSSYHWGTIQGAAIYHLDNKSNLIELSAYGLPFLDGLAIFSIWDDNIAALAVRDKQVVTKIEVERKFIALPLVLDGIPNGCLVMMMTPESDPESDGKELAPFVSKFGAYFLQMQLGATNGHSNGAANGNAAANVSTFGGSPEDLTTRQVQILTLIADGLTNAEIALRVLLSESTVRQETVRIYRALGVNSRIEAVAKGRSVGLIPRLEISSPPRNLIDEDLK